MIDRYILNADGEPERCDDWLTWALWFETAERQVCEDYDEGDETKRVRVSTVFLGLNHNFRGKGPPILWETLVFANDVPEIHNLGRRYSSRDAAVLGHQEICEQVSIALRARQAQEPYG